MSKIFEAAVEIGILAADRIDLSIDQHDAVVDAHFVGQRAFGHFDLGELTRIGWIADVDDDVPFGGFTCPT